MTQPPDLRRARALEHRGQVEAAVQAYLEVGAFREASRMLVAAGQVTRAASVLAKAAQSCPQKNLADELWGEAATLLEGSKDFASAAKLWAEAKRPHRQAQALARGHHWPAAAKVFETLREWAHAGACYQKAGLVREALAAYLRVSPSESYYRRACVEAIPLVIGLNVRDEAVAKFFEPFVAHPPSAGVETERQSQWMAWWRPSVSASPAPAPLRLAQAGSVGLGGVVGGRYRLDRFLGEGGLARVFQALDLELQEAVALKFFKNAEANPALNDFREELRLTRQLSHPNLIRIFDLGVHEGHRFLTLELLEGEDLRAKMVQPMAVDRALGFVVQACAGLQAAHDAGIVHRDVKPENLFVVQNGNLKVMDFGLARRTTQAGTSLIAAGTPAYVSPEQIQAFDTAGPSADIYSLGVVSYELLVGRPPFEESSVAALLEAHLHRSPESLRKHRPDLPAELDAIVLRMLEKAPARRFSSCREVAAALEPIRQRFAFDDFL